MTGRKGRRKVRKRKAASENSGVKFSLFLGIIFLAVGLGFLTARFVIGPLIGYDAEESPAQELSENREQSVQKAEQDTEKKEKERKTENANAEADTERTDSDDTAKEGYALQFGAFSSKEAAQELSDALKAKGIQTHVVEVDKVFKVMSPITDEKDAALQNLEKVKDKEITDVFITAVGAEQTE